MSLFSLFEKPKASVAVSFDDGMLRYVSLMRSKEGVAVSAYGSEPVAQMMDGGRVIDEPKFVALLRSLAGREAFASANVVIPDGEAVVFHTHVAKAPDRQMNDVIVDHLKTYCEAHDLLDYAEYVCEYDIILETDFGYDLHVTLVPKQYVAHLARLFKQAGMQVPHIETAHHAVARECLGIETGEGYVAVSIGRTKTSVSLVHGTHMVAHDVVGVGSDSLIATVERELRVARSEAERIIGRYGVLGSHPDLKMLSALHRAIEPIAQAADRMVVNAGTQQYRTFGARFRVSGLVAYGPGISVKGLVATIGEQANLPARELDVWAGRSDRAPILSMPASELPAYAEPIALALLYLD